MPASPMGFGNFFMDRNINMPSGYQLLGCPPGMHQPPPHLVGMAGVPLPFSGIPGYSFIPYPHPGHMAHIVSILKHYFFLYCICIITIQCNCFYSVRITHIA